MRCIPVWNRCNNRCVMCSNPPEYARMGGYALAQLKARLRRVPVAETALYFTGGEPTLHPDFLELLAYARSRLPRTRILVDTNGRMFSYPSFVARCASTGNLEFQVSLCGFDAASHDGVTRTPGSFDQAVKGLGNLLRLGVDAEVRFVLSGLSLKNLEKVYAFVRREFPGVRALVLIFLEMEGHAGVNLKAAGLTYAEARGRVEAFFAARDRERRPPPFELKLYHFPLCVLPPGLWKYAWRTLPGKEVAFPPACRGCAVRAHCLGVHKDYLRHVGAAEFSPVEAAPRLKLSANPCHPVLEARSLP